MSRLFAALVCALISLSLLSPGLAAESHSPWGAAQEMAIEYAPRKVVYDVDSKDEKALTSALDRASYLNNLYGADPFDSSIVMVIHGPAIEFFASKHYAKYAALMRRAKSLTVGSTIEFRICAASAKLKGYTAKDMHGFARMVPMADAEIVRLQADEGYAYMR